jgi:hypothetical protein
MNVDDKVVAGDSGDNTAEVGDGTDEGAGGVHAGTNVVGNAQKLAGGRWDWRRGRWGVCWHQRGWECTKASRCQGAPKVFQLI